MKNEPRKPDLRDKMFEPKTAIDTKDTTFAEQPSQDDTPHIVEPGPVVHTPGQVTKQ